MGRRWIPVPRPHTHTDNRSYIQSCSFSSTEKLNTSTNTDQSKQMETRSKTTTTAEKIDARKEDTKISEVKKKRKMTMAELDEELRMKLEGISGEGGASGIEYEGGKAEGLKRGVKENMFRVI